MESRVAWPMGKHKNLKAKYMKPDEHHDLVITVTYGDKTGVASSSFATIKDYDLAKHEDRVLLIDRYMKSALYAALKVIGVGLDATVGGDRISVDTSKR